MKVDPLRMAASVAGVAAAAVFLAGVWGIGERRGPPSGTTPVAATSFHGGKEQGDVRRDPTCQAKGCHVPFPHKKMSADSAFDNFHQRFVECLACHGRDAEKHWRQDAVPGGPERVLRGPSAAAVKEPHMILRPPMTCRGCHSAAGRKALRDAGATDLKEGFENPIALRMLEEGGTRWGGESFR